MKKILFVFPSISAGGAERNAIMISNYLVNTYKYEIDFLIYDNSSHYKSIITSKIKTLQLEIGHNSLNPIKKYFYTYLYYGYLAYRYSKDKKYDKIVGVHEIEAEIPLIEASFLFKLFCPSKSPEFISIIQSTIFDRYKNRKKIIVKLLNFFRQIVFQKIIAVSNSIKNEMEVIYKGEIIVIHNTVQIDYVLARADEKLDYSSRELTKKPYFLNIGRICLQKNQIILLEAFNRIKTKTNTNLVIIGDSNDQRIVRLLEKFIEENYLQNRVFLLGKIENPFPYMKRAKALVSTSLYEGFPLVILEAMSLNKTIVSSTFNGYQELLNERNSFHYTYPSDLDELLLFVDNNENEILDRQNQAYLTAQKCDLNKIGEDYHNFFNCL